MFLLLSEGYATSSRRKFLTIVSNATFFNKRKKKFRNATLGDTREAKACLPYWLCFQFLCGASLYLAWTVHIWMAPIPVVIVAFIDILSVICWRGHWYRLPSPDSVRGYELIHKDCHWLFVFFMDVTQAISLTYWRYKLRNFSLVSVHAHSETRTWQ